MRIDCYNASECTIDEIDYGDTFYLNGILYIHINQTMFGYTDNQYAVDLATGMLEKFKPHTVVIKADAVVRAEES